MHVLHFNTIISDSYEICCLEKCISFQRMACVHMNICMYSTRMAATVSTYAHLYAFMTYTVHLLS